MVSPILWGIKWSVLLLWGINGQSRSYGDKMASLPPKGVQMVSPHILGKDGQSSSYGVENGQSVYWDLRIDNGGLECMCTWLCVFSDILAIH